MLRAISPLILAGTMLAAGPAAAAQSGTVEIEAGTSLLDLGVRRNHDGPLVLVGTDEKGRRLAHFFKRGEDIAHRSVVIDQGAASSKTTQSNPRARQAAFHPAPNRTSATQPYNGRINTTAFQREVESISRRYGVDPALVRAVMHTESFFQPEALSSAGALGLMQLMPATAERFGVTDRTDPVQSIEGGVKYLRFLLDTFDQIEHAIAGYNAGEGAVQRHGGIPPFSETQQFVPLVLARYERYREAME
ncbi:lytic transglycosylase domain-containing protein [Thioalkalivibrio sp. ALE16]|uniref:lytic transglycosylase domain-containing protein n=1 Tax=Thioalkalivibrio sp. ALE16 TaxID=1158172 RepID=UPI0009DBEA8E|nr:lytic transglycosylase domain-containing protein [Thioalkalivibrio sp. ALE16]